MFFVLTTNDPIPSSEPRRLVPGHPAISPEFSAIYASHASFVWRSLRRLGVREKDVDDSCQETFMIVHRKLDQFTDGSMRAWLFAIASRVASDYRKRAHVRREVFSADPAPLSEEERQSGALDQKRALEWLDAVVAQLDEDKRSVFILYELEEMSMAEVAIAVGCPPQTAYSRLHAARKEVTSAIERWQAKDRRQS